MGSIHTLSDLRAALWRQLWHILLVLVVGLSAVVLYAKSRPRLYEAIAVIQIEAPEVTITSAGQVRGLTADGQLDLLTQVLMARANIVHLIREHGLFPEIESETLQVAALREAITTVKLIDPAQAWRPDIQPTGLSITVRLDEPEAAANVANALLDQIIADAHDRAEGRAERTLEFLTAEESRVSAQISEVEDRIATFRTTNIEALPEGLTAQRDRLNRLTETRFAIEQQRLELQGSAGRLRPEEAAAQAALIAEQIRLVDADIALVESALAMAPDIERQLTAMTRTLDQLEAQLTVLTQQRTEAATNELLASQEQAGRFVVLEHAEIPDSPVSMSRTKLAIAGGVAVGMFALGLALMLEITHPAIRNARQMERLLGSEPVIVVPRLRSSRSRRWRRAGVVLGVGVFLAALLSSLALWSRSLAALFGVRRSALRPASAGEHLQ